MPSRYNTFIVSGDLTFVKYLVPDYWASVCERPFVGSLFRNFGSDDFGLSS